MPKIRYSWLSDYIVFVEYQNFIMNCLHAVKIRKLNRKNCECLTPPNSGIVDLIER